MLFWLGVSFITGAGVVVLVLFVVAFHQAMKEKVF